MKTRSMLMGAAAAAAVAISALAAAQNKQTGPVAIYWMTAETSSGFGAMANQGASGMLGAMMGGRDPSASVAHMLHLQLGSSRKASAAPAAEHVPPQGLRAGASLPLVTPQESRGGATAGTWPANMERPKGKMLIYWGCGEKARPGQPVVIDFASLMSGKTPAGFTGVAFKPMTPPSQGSSATYGEWPNQRSRTTVPANGSLVGEHVVRGNYTPDIRFALAQNQDFLAPLRLTTNAPVASGAVQLAWQPVGGALAYFASAMGAGENDTFVLWSSSEVQLASMLADYLPADELARLVKQKALLSPATTSCAVPAEVTRAAPQAMLSMIAFGPEANFSYPPRPSDPKAPWNLEWAAKVRTKSTNMAMLGMSMDEMMAGGSEASEEPAPKKKKRSLLERGLGKILPKNP